MRRTIRSVCAVGLALLFGACSGDTQEVVSNKCTPGATQDCVGPAGCQGGQVCASDGTWGACDCGGQGGNGATGGDASRDASDDASGAGGNGGGIGGVSGAATGGVTADGAPDESGTGGSAGTPWTPDPCPSEPIEEPSGFDCSGDCGPVHSTCAESVCSRTEAIQIPAEGETFIYRTPDAPQTACNCSDGRYMVGVRVGNAPPVPLVARVGEPWLFGLTDAVVLPPFDACADIAFVSDCVEVIDNKIVYLVAYDLNAPARNVIFERGTCE